MVLSQFVLSKKSSITTPEMQTIQSSKFYSTTFTENYSSSKSLILWKSFSFGSTQDIHRSSTFKPFLGQTYKPKKRLIAEVVSSKLSSSILEIEQLQAWDDEYEGVIIDASSLPLSAYAFGSALRASLLSWKLKGKKGVWLKILQNQAHLVPIAVQEGFNYHHAEPGYVMFTYWIPNQPCGLPTSPSHQIGIAGFVINDKKEILVVKEKCSCSCLGVWKLPTGYINKDEDIFSGAIREVKEETGVDTSFLEMVAFRHAHHVAFEKSDLMFVCMLKPLSSDITIDVDEIDDAKWMTVEEVLEQSFYIEDHMLRKIIEVCIKAYERINSGFVAHRLTSKFDGNMAYLYYNDSCMSS